MNSILSLFQTFRLCAGVLLISGAILSPPSSFAKAPQQVTSILEKARVIEQAIEKLPQGTLEVYERLELLETYQTNLEALAKKEPQNAYIQALLGLTFVRLADTRSELGVNTIDYWAYVSEVVDPLRSQAKKHFDTAIASPELPQAPRAWSYYCRAQLTSEYDLESTQSDYTKACELGHTKACQILKESK